MPKKSGQFDQSAYVADWQKKNMSSVSVRYKTSFVEEFRKALITTGKKQSDVIRKAMEEVIKEAEEINTDENQENH